LVEKEIKYTFKINETGTERDIAELSIFNDGSVYFKVFHRTAERDCTIYANSHRTLKEFAEKVSGLPYDIALIPNEIAKELIRWINNNVDD
jgi:hypothetical protein